MKPSNGACSEDAARKSKGSSDGGMKMFSSGINLLLEATNNLLSDTNKDSPSLEWLDEWVSSAVMLQLKSK